MTPNDDTGRPAQGPPDPELVRELLRDPAMLELLAETLAGELETRRAATPWKRMQPWLAGAASALVTMLAFFLPSLQDQWDRWQSREVVQRYVELGRGFMDDGRFRLAEESFGKAFELSESRRLDVEELRLEARVAQVDADPEWGKPNPGTLHESDFLYLLQLQAHAPLRRATTLNSYGVFLAGERRWREAEDALRGSLAIDSTRAATWLHLGNLLADRELSLPAERAYRRALAADTTMSEAPYDLGLLLAGNGRLPAADTMFALAVRLEPGDPDALRQRIDVLERMGRAAQAAALRPALLRLERLAPPQPRDVPPASADEPAGH